MQERCRGLIYFMSAAYADYFDAFSPLFDGCAMQDMALFRRRLMEAACSIFLLLSLRQHDNIISAMPIPGRPASIFDAAHFGARRRRLRDEYD